MAQQQQQQHVAAWPAIHSSKLTRRPGAPGALLLASIGSSGYGNPFGLPAFRPPWAPPLPPCDGDAAHAASSMAAADSAPAGAHISTGEQQQRHQRRAPMPVGQLALTPPQPPEGSSPSPGCALPGGGVSAALGEPRTAAQTWVGETSSSGSSTAEQRDPRRPFWLGRNPNGGGPGTDEPLLLLGRHMQGEAGRLVGVLGTQLVLALTNAQRRLRNGGSVADEAATPPGIGFGPFRLRLPWQRAGPDAEGSARSGGDGDSGSSSAWQVAAAARSWVAKGVAAERAFDLRGALACYTNAVALEPGNMEHICRLAKQWSDLTYEPGADQAQIVEANGKAVTYAERAVALAPGAAAGYMALCVSRGRLALFSDNKTKVHLAKEAREAAVKALELEPDNDLAHHLMGRWHFEMAQIPFVVRQLVRLVYGASLAPGTFADALTEFGTAVELAPARLIHRVEYGRTLLRLGHKREALAELQLSLRLDVDDINAQLQRDDAELLVAGLEKELARHITWGFPGLEAGGDVPVGGAPVGTAAAPAASVSMQAKAADEGGNNSSGRAG